MSRKLGPTLIVCAKRRHAGVSGIRTMVAHAHCAYTTSDRTAPKIYFCKIRESYVPNLVTIGAQITSQSCPRTPDGRTDGRTETLT